MTDRTTVAERTPIDGLQHLVELAPKATSAHAYVREALRRAILTGKIPAGTRLIQADLAASFSVSTTPVRDAIRDLAADGLVRLDYRGGLVEKLSKESLNDLMEIREALEPIAVRRASARADATLIRRLRFLNEQMAGEESAADWVHLNRQFHKTVAEASGSPRLAAILSQLGDVYTAYGAGNIDIPGTRERGVREHAQIIAALDAHDAETAVDVMAKHVRNVAWTFEPAETPSVPDTIE